MSESREPVPPKLLLAMRWVFGNPDGTERNQEERTCRVWFKENLSAFLSKMNDLEKDFMGLQRTARAKEAKAVGWDGVGACPVCGREADALDPADGRLDELTARLLEEAGA